MMKWIRSVIEERQEQKDIHNVMANDNMEKLKELTKRFNEHAEIITTVYEALLHGVDACYIADIQTFDILWVNKTVNRLHGENLVGLKCYEAFQDSNAPCSFCTNKILESRSSYTWVFFNEKLQKRFLIRDRLINWDGRAVRLETAINITELKFTDDKLPGCTRKIMEGIVDIRSQRAGAAKC